MYRYCIKQAIYNSKTETRLHNLSSAAQAYTMAHLTATK